MVEKAPNATGPAFDDEDQANTPSLIFDPAMGHLKCFYALRPGNGNQIVSLRTSEDGVSWTPRVTVPAPPGWGTSVVDQRASVPADERYVLMQYDGGLYSAFSGNGLSFTRRPGELSGQPDVDDIIDISRDPLTHQWVVLYKAWRQGYGQSRTGDGRGIRVTRRTTSYNLRNWTAPVDFLLPDPVIDDPLTEFYGATIVARPGLLVAFVRVLKDSVGVDGVGFTSLAWSRDGTTWTRQRASFLDKADDPAAFDHSVAWVYGAVEFLGRIWLAYSAYRDGHKIGPRRVGVTSVPLDHFDGLGL